MSTQRSKKKRLGSHRRVANQNETPKVDELHVTDSISVAQRQIPEENESLSVLPNTDSLQRETQHPPSPDLTLNRRKLGSRRKNKGQHVKDSATELYHEPGEEVEENTKGTEAQSERQEELGNVSVQDMSATHDSSLYSAITPGYSCEVQNPAATNCSDDVLEILISQGRNQKADQDENETDCEVKSYSCKRVETMLEVTDKSGMPQSKEVTENVVGGSDSTSLSVPSCPTVDQQLIAQSDSREMPEEHLSVYCAKEKENRERDKDTDLSRQDGNLQGNYLISESHVESVVPGFSTTAEITIDKNSPRQDTGLECGVEQATFSLPTEELPADENQNEQFSLPLNSQARDTSVWIEEQTDTNFNPTLNRRKLGSSRRNKGRQHVKNSIGESYYETKEDIVENGSNEAFETTEMSSLIDTAVHATSLETMLEGMDKSDTSGQSSTLHPSPSDDQRLIDQSNDREMPREEVPSVDSVTDTERTEREEDTDLLRQWGILQSHVISDHVNVNQPTEIQKNHLIDYSSGSVINDATENSEIHFANLTDQAGVSDTYQTVAESYQKPQEEGVEDVEDITGNKALQITSVALQSSQEDREHDIIMSVTHDDSLNTESTSDYSSEVQNPATTTYPEADLESVMTKNENLQEIHDERETGFKVELSDKSLEATLEGLDRADTLQSEEANDTHSEDNVTEVHEQDVKPTQIQKMHESDYTFESVVHDTAEYSDTCSGNLRDQDEVSDTYQFELLVESIDDPAPMQEVSDPDDKQNEPPTKESNVEVLDQIDEDDHVYDNKKPQTSDRERIDTALDQAYDNEGQAEDDIKATAEQTGHQEKEGLLSDMEESESSLQTLQSQTNAPWDSQPLDNPLKTDEQNDADFNPIRNRRKLGSSRRNKGRQHVKGSGAESYHKPTEDVVRNTRDNEPFETTKMSLTIETEVQEISMETMLEGKDTFETSQTEEVSDKVNENAHVSTSELTSIGLYSSPSVDQQITDQSNVREMPDEELHSVSSVTDTESKERDKDTDLLGQANNLVSDSHLKSEGIESLITQDISTEKSSHGQRTEPEGSVEQATISSPKVKLSTNEEQNEHFSLSEVRGAQHSEDAVKKVHEEEEVKPREMQEIHLIDCSSESVIQDATDISEICSGNPQDQAEGSETYQSELLVKSIDDPSPKKEVSDPDDKQDEYSTEETNVEVLDQIDEDDHVYDTKKPQTSDRERIDTALDQAYENEGRAEDDIKATAEETGHQEKEGLLSDMDESESSLKTLQSETNAPLNSQLQDNYVKTDEQNDTDFNPIRNRRKMGSSRRNKGQQHVKGSGAESYHKPTEEDVEDITGNKALQITSVALQTSQEDREHDIIMSVTHDDSLNTESTSDYSSEVQNPATTTYPEADLESLMTENENFQEIHDERENGFKVELSDKSFEATLEGLDRADTLQSEEANDTHSEDNVTEVHEQDVKPTQIQKMHESDYTFESVVHDTAEYSDTCSGNLRDQNEVSDTYQSELLVESIDDPAPMQELSDPDDTQDEPPTKESYVEVLDQIDEDDHIYDTKKPQTSDRERIDTALDQAYDNEGRAEDDIKATAEQTGHQEKEGLLSAMDESESSLQTLQSETNAPLNTQLQHNYVRTDEQNDTDFNPIRNRRKMGSSRRNKGRQHVKGSGAESYHKPTEENVEDITGNKALQITTSVALQTSQEDREHDIIMSVTHDDSLNTESTSDYSSEVQNPATTTYPEADLESLMTENENFQEIHDERETGFKVELSDKSFEATLEGLDRADTLQSEEANDTHSEDNVTEVHEQDVKPTQIQKMHESDYTFESVVHDTAEYSDTCSGNLRDQNEVSDTYQFELLVESIDDPAPMQELSDPDDTQDEPPTKESYVEVLDQIDEDDHVYDTKKPQTSDRERIDTALDQAYDNEGQAEDDIKPSAEQTGHQEKEGLLSDMGESESSLQTLQSETNAPWDSQPLDNPLKTDEQNDADFNPIRNRRKLGSSRRNKGRQHVKGSGAESYHKPTEDVVRNTRDNEPFETTKMSLTIETAVQEISMETMLEGKDTFETSQTEEVSDKVNENAHVSTSELTSIGLYSSPSVNQQITDQSNVREMPDEELHSVSSVTDTESKERDKDTDLLGQANNLVSDSHLKSEGIESLITQDISTEKSSHGQRTEPEGSVEQATISSPKEKLSTNEEQNEHFSLSEVRGAQHSEDAVKKVHEEEEVKPREMQEIHLIDCSSESVIQDATDISEICSGNPQDQAEGSETYQSELLVKSIDDPSPKKEASDPDDKQDEYSTEETNVEVLDQIDEDDHVYDTKKPQTSDRERIDTALDQAYDNEGRAEDDIKATAEETGHQEKEGLLSDMDESESSLKTLQSETNAPLNSQLQDNYVKTDEQNDTDFNPIRNRRKMGSSRRNKGQQHVKGSGAESYHKPTEEDVEDITGNKALQITTSVAFHTTSQEDREHDIIMSVTHDDSLNTESTSDYSSEVQNPATTTYPEADLESLMTENENFQEIHDERETGFKVELSDKSLEATLEGLDRADTLQSEEANDTHSEDNVTEVHEQDVKPTQIQKMHESDYTFESVVHDTAEYSDTCSGNLRDQDEVSDTYQSELLVESIDDPAPMQELSDPDDKQDEPPTKECNVEALDQIDEDDHVYDTKKPQTSDRERIDTALDQAYDNEGQAEDDIKATAEQTGHQEKEGLLSDMEESESSLQTLQSQTNAPWDSQPLDNPLKTDEQNDADFNPIRNKRKLGSSRRNKGRQHVKGSGAESYHKPTEVVVRNTRDNEPFETTKMSLTIETAVQEISMETMLEGKDTFETSQTEEVSDKVNENAHVSTSELTSIGLYSSPSVNQQITDQSNVREMPDEELHSVSSVTDTESKERDKDTDLLGQANNLVSDSHLKSEGIESLITQDISTEKSSHGQRTEPEGSVEQATISSPKEKLSTNEEQNEHFSLSEVRGAQHSEDAVKKVHEEEEVKPREMQEIHLIDCSSESVIQDATDISEICSGNPQDQAEGSETYQSELLVKSIDDPSPKKEVSDPDDEQDEYSTEETNVEVLDQIDEDDHVYDTKKPQTSDRERIDTALDQAYENEGRAEDDIKATAEKTGHQEKEGLLSDMDESESSLKTLQSETNAPLNSQLQDNYVKTDEQNDTDFNPIRNRRKMGSSRRNKGQQHVKGSGAESYHKPTEEDVEDITGNKALQITTSVALQTSQEDREHDIIMSDTHDDSLNTESTSDYSSEGQNPATTTYPEADLESLMTENENFQEIHDERETGFKVELSDKSLEATLEGLDRADTLQSEEANDTHSEDNVTEVHEQDVKPTQIQKMHESDYTFESVVHDTAEYSDTCSGNLRDQDEVSDTYQFELLVESIDDPAPMQELSDPDDKQDEPPTKECNVEALDQIDEDDHVYDTKKPQTSDRERIDTALDQVYDREGQAEDDIKPSAEQTGHQEKEGLLSDMEESESSLQTLQSETDAPSDSQPLDNPLKTDEQNDADFNPIRNRRKLGSSRRNKGRQHVKGSGAESYHKPTEDVVRNTTDNEPLETTKMSLTIETAVQEISIETMLEGKETFNLSQTLGVAQATISSPKEELSTNEEQNEHFSLSEVRGAQHSEDAVHEEEEVKLTEMQKMHQFDYSSIKESKPSLESLQSEIWSPLESQPMDNSQSIKEETHSGFKTTRNRRKLGSSRRNKGRQHVPESVTEPYPEEEVVENTWRNEASETEEIPSGTGTMWQEELKEHTYSSTIETTDIALRSDKNDFLKSIEEVSEEEKKHIKEPENLTPLTGYDTVKIDLIQSEEASTERTTDVQGPVQVEEREEYEDPANKDRAAQEIDIPNVVTHAELLSAAQNKTDTWDPFDIGHEENQSANPAMDVSEESGISTAGDACNSQQDIQEKDKSLVDNSESLQGKVKQKKRKMGSTRRTQLNRKQEGETDNKDETIERNLDMEVDVRKLDRMEVVEELPLIPTTEEKENTQPSLGTVYKEQLETNETSSVHDKRHLQQSSDLQTVESNVKPGTEDLMVLPPGQSASYNEEVVNPVAFLHGAYVRDSEGNVDVSVEPPQQDDFTSTEMQTASVVAGRNRRSIDQLLSSNTEGAMNTDSDITLYSSETAQSTQNDQALKLTEVPSVAVADLEKVKSVVRGEAEEEHENAQASAQEQNYVNEGAHNTSPHFSSTNRRRKLGSTRRNLGSRSKGEDLHQKQEVDNEATAINVGDVLTEGVSGIDEKELQIHNEHKDGDSAQRKEKVFETVEYRHTGESQVKPIAHQAVEENPDFLSQLVETEHQLTPDHLPATPSTSPKHDGGRRRKMGSHRKSRGHQHFEDQTEREGRIIDAQKVRDESATKTAEGHTEESSGLDIISEVDECNQKSSSSISKATEHTRPKSEKAPKWVNPVQYPQAEIRLGQDSQKLSFAGADIRSKSYDVLMVGDSSVGKTSFMKRAQSGKFSLDLPASVGLDSCMWTVVVDGKPVVLQLWDTAGQERFHSITRQVFHKAQAFLLMYDITSSQSFTAVSYWANCIQEGAAEDVTILLLGNKSDHAKRQVKTQEGEILAKEYNFQFMECSAATGENVIQSLETVARMLRQKVDTTEEAVVLHQEPPQKKRSGCC